MWVKPFREPGKLSPPDARAISSRCVRLGPGDRVGEHVTAGREEILFVLEGEASLLVGDAATTVRAGHSAYVGPEVRHDVANLTDHLLLYVYVTAKAPAT